MTALDIFCAAQLLRVQQTLRAPYQAVRRTPTPRRPARTRRHYFGRQPGLCRRCPNPAVSHRALCASCAQKHRERMRAWWAMKRTEAA